jgi:hypothetical protein
MKVQIIKKGAVNTKKQGMTCDVMVDEPPMDKK